jgi:hypothetical protein
MGDQSGIGKAGLRVIACHDIIVTVGFGRTGPMVMDQKADR